MTRIRHVLTRLIEAGRRGAACAAMLAAACATALTAGAQNDVQLAQYWAVPAYFNPASTGDTDYLRIRGGTRLQWIGIRNAPKSFFGTADSPLKIGRQRIGLGVNAMQESLGLFSNLIINLQASYKLKLFKGELSIGIQGGYFDQKFKGSKIVIPEGDDYHQGADEALPQQDLAGHTFDLSAGLSYTHKYFYVGIAGQHLLQPTVEMAIEGSEANDAQQFESQLGRMFYFTGGSNIQLKNTLFELQPSFMVRTDFKTVGAEVTMRARYNRFLTFGAAYRWNNAVAVMAAGEFKGFFLGYAYEYPLSAIARASSGSHEIVAGYSLKLDFSGKNKNKHRSIRIM